MDVAPHAPRMFGAHSGEIAQARNLHLAEGVLVALRRQTPEVALSELVAVARAAQVSPFRLADALVTIAGRCPTDQGDLATVAVNHAWGELLNAGTDEARS